MTTSVWHHPASSLHKTLIIADGRVFIGSADESRLGAIQAGAADPESVLAALGSKAVCINDQKLESIECESQSKNITARYSRNGQSRWTMVSFSDLHQRDAALVAIDQALRLSRSTEQWSRFRAAKSPAMSLALLTVLVFVLSNAANELSAGGEVNISGRHRGSKRILVFVLNLIGMTGVYVLGASLALAAMYWLYRRMTSPPKTIALKPVA